MHEMGHTLGKNKFVPNFIVRVIPRELTICFFSFVLGFYHEQSRPDRDQNVYIIWNNINPGMNVGICVQMI